MDAKEKVVPLSDGVRAEIIAHGNHINTVLTAVRLQENVPAHYVYDPMLMVFRAPAKPEEPKEKAEKRGRRKK